MKRYELAALTETEYRKLLRRSETDISAHLPLAMEVINRVREEGDKALLDYTMKFDGISLEGKSLRVTEKEIAEAFDKLDNPTRDTLQYAAENIKKFHREQLPPEMWLKEIDGGLLAGEKVTPISDVCLYVPRGKGSFPSVMLMLGIPAVVPAFPGLSYAPLPEQAVRWMR